jgi:DNA-binding NtrC family response regulator
LVVKPKLLLVDDNIAFAKSLVRVLREQFQVKSSSSADEGRAMFRQGCDVVLLDLRLNDADPNNREGVDLLKEFHTLNSEIPIVMMTAYGDIEVAVEVMKEGAADFLQKPFDLTKLKATLSNALEQARLKQRISSLEQDYARIEPGEIVGQSPVIENIRRLIDMAAKDGYVTVLINGETGTGKELIARAIHRQGWRSKESFVPVAISALSPTLVESELFGHEAGAFTGAKGRRAGYIEKAKGGVLFLDEVGEIPRETQVKLLRFLEERKFFRVGSTESIETDVQILVATHRDFQQAVENGQIRQDLYFRLKSLVIPVAPLRERIDDISLLANHCLKLFRDQGRTKISSIDPEVMELLMRYHWPGNVRELKTALERAVIYANNNGHLSIEKDDLPVELLCEPHLNSEGTFPIRLNGGGINLNQQLARWELAYIEKALQLTQGRKTEAWKLLRLNDRFALHRRISTLFKKYPNLVSGFATLKELYDKD